MVKGERIVVPWAQLTTLGSVVKVRAPGWSDPAGQKLFFAEVAELVDALASGASGGNPVEVQVLSSVPTCFFIALDRDRSVAGLHFVTQRGPAEPWSHFGPGRSK